MTKFLAQNSIGKAGEYYFAYMISHILGWPCRLLDIDIGIDAQIEVLGKDRSSTGRFIAVQIKTTRDSKNGISVSKKQIDYWRKIESEVMIAFVNLSEMSVYTKFLTDIHVNDSSSTIASSKITFTKQDTLTKNRASEWRARMFSEEREAIKKILEEIKVWSSEIIKDVDRPVQRTIDIELPDSTCDNFREYEAKLHHAKILVERTLDQIGDCGYKTAHSSFRDARDAFVMFAEEKDLFHYNPEKIRNFESDYFARFDYLKLNQD